MAGRFEEMEYELVKGKREGALLAYVPCEKCLYIFKIERNGYKEFICYQTVLSKQKKKKKKDANNNQIKCMTRIRLLDDKICERTSNHQLHQNHEALLRDFNKINAIKESAHVLRDRFPLVAHRISTREIFQPVYVE